MSIGRAFAPVTDIDLARARQDAAFRQQLLTQNLEFLLGKLQKLRAAPGLSRDTAKHIREGAALAVKLAELLQSRPGAHPS